MKNTLEDLRAMAIKLLETQDNNVALNTWGNNVKDLLQELSIYHVELEHQNQALEESEKTLAESQARFVKLFENAPVGYVVINGKGIIVQANQTFLNLFVPAKSRNSVVEGRSFDEFICPEFKSTFDVFCNMIKKPGIPVPIELKLFDRFSVPHYVLLTAGERQENEKLYQLTISDIAMQKRLEAQLVREKEKAEESDRQKSLFLTSVSHELRTPLATIVGFCEMLGDNTLDRLTRANYITAVRDSGKMLTTLADEILDLSVLESGVVPLKGVDTDVSKICNEMIALLQRRIIGKNVLLRNELDDMPILCADQMRLRQMISVILDHAVGNATEGHIAIRGRFEMSDDEDGVLILLFTGANIFSGESSIDPDIRRKPVSQNCAGLGMFLAKQIIKAMNGRMIWLHPLDTLRIEIPLKKSNIKVKPNDQHSDPDPGVQPGWKCLLVDDVVLNLKVLAGMMRRMNCETVLASSGKDALELLSHNHFDAIFTDMWMPGMSGEELAVQIRQNPSYDSIPIFAITADVESEKNFDMSFFVQTLIKPVNLEKLRKAFMAMNTSKEINQ